jgi:hypothetical protein
MMRMRSLAHHTLAGIAACAALGGCTQDFSALFAADSGADRKTTPSEAASDSEATSDAAPISCMNGGGLGQACGFHMPCCATLACTTGGTCQHYCVPLGDNCMGGPDDTCCRMQGFCASGTCISCLDFNASCRFDNQCCSGNCSTSQGTCD